MLLCVPGSLTNVCRQQGARRDQALQMKPVNQMKPVSEGSKQADLRSIEKQLVTGHQPQRIPLTSCRSTTASNAMSGKLQKATALYEELAKEK